MVRAMALAVQTCCLSKFFEKLICGMGQALFSKAEELLEIYYTDPHTWLSSIWNVCFDLEFSI